MKTAKWYRDAKVLYWKQRVNEQDLLETQEDAKKEAFDKGKLKGEIKGEISKIKMGIDNQIPEDNILKKLSHTRPSVKN